MQRLRQTGQPTAVRLPPRPHRTAGDALMAKTKTSLSERQLAELVALDRQTHTVDPGTDVGATNFYLRLARKTPR